MTAEDDLTPLGTGALLVAAGTFVWAAGCLALTLAAVDWARHRRQG